jgi:hypothetical protein
MVGTFYRHHEIVGLHTARQTAGRSTSLIRLEPQIFFTLNL